MSSVQTKKDSPKGTKSKVHVSNSAQLDANNPIPFEYGGHAFSYLTGSRYIPFLSPGDDFFKTLLEARVLSVTHSACVETKKTYCTGQGLYDKNGNEFTDDQSKWLRRINAKNETAKVINRKIFGSFFTFGNAPVEVVRFTFNRKPYLYIYAHNVLEWRLAWPDNNGNVTEAIQSKLFLRQGIITDQDLKSSRTLPIYNPARSDKKNWKKDDKGVERTLIWLKNDYDGYEHYGMPSAIASLIHQVEEYKGERYNLDNFENNMVSGGVLALKGNLDDAEAKKIGKEIIKTHTGDGKRGRITVVASEEGIDGSEFHQYDTQTDGSFVKLSESLMQKIIFANEWDATLAGLSSQNALGKGNSYLRTIYNIKKKTVIDPAQEFLINNLWQPIQEIAKAWLHNGFDQFDLDIMDIDPISILADVDPTEAVQVNEMRAAIGLPDDPKMKGVYMKSKGAKPAPEKEGGEDV